MLCMIIGIIEFFSLISVLIILTFKVMGTSKQSILLSCSLKVFDQSVENLVCYWGMLI